MTKEQLEYLERIKQLAELGQDECNTAMGTILTGILVNIALIKEEEKNEEAL